MRAFAAGEIDVLVSTTVIEVGVDVANATTMVLLDADRFGVSQLHQLRGRVGRGGLPGPVPAGHPRRRPAPRRASGSTPWPRTTDGFELSRVDLEQRREGDVLGRSQSGFRSSLQNLRCCATRRRSWPPARPPRPARRRPDLAAHPRLAAAVAEMEAITAGRLHGEVMTPRSGARHDADHRRAAGGRRIQTPRGAAPDRRATGCARRCSRPSSPGAGRCSGLRFLDLYAGSGAVGLEAWSRGAGVVTLVEHDRRTAALIDDNAETLGFAQADVVTAPVAAALRRPPAAPYDVVFLDPPYPLDDDGVGSGPRAAGRPATGWSRARWSSSSGRRAAPSRPGRTGFTDVRGQALRRDHALVRSRRRPAARRPATARARSSLMRRAVCPGSFDPVTNGHLDIVEPGVRALRRGRRRGRRQQVQEPPVRRPRSGSRCSSRPARGFDNVRVAGFTGLLTDFCREHDIHAIVKGLRAVTDFDYELQMAQMNARSTDVETVFVPDQPGVLLRRVQPGQGGRGVRRRRVRPGARLRARAARRPAGRARRRP